jgi:hypothetical protein
MEETLFDIPRAEAIDSEILESFARIRSAERSLKGVREFTELRASSFPICPRAYHISRRLPRKKRPLKKESYMGEASALMGTALHFVTQKWFGINYPDNWYGNYECVFCDRMIYHKYGLQRCKKCGREMVYKEYVVERQKGIPFSGHLDGVLRFADGENHLIDFKGAYFDKIKKVKNLGTVIENHYYQVNGYACAVNKGKVDCGDLTKIDKIMIIYIDRGRPYVFWYPVQVSPSKRIFRKTKELIKIGKKSLKTLRIPQGLCDNARDPNATWCGWNPLCFSPNLSSMLGSKIYDELKFKKHAVPTLDLLLQAENLRNQSS